MVERIDALHDARVPVGAAGQPDGEVSTLVSDFIWNGLSEGLYLASPDWRILRLNAGLASMLGYTSTDELVGADVSTLYESPENRRQLQPDIERNEAIDHLDQALRHKNGKTVTVTEHGRMLRDAAGRSLGYEAIVLDVTDLRRLEEQFRHAQKMEAVGRLAGGVAHDFNNVLTAIVGYVELLLAEPQNEKTRNGLREMQRASVRASGLTRQLLAFSRQQLLQPTVVDLNDVVRQLHNLLRPLIGENVELVMELETALASTRADVGQLEQVIVNLAVNARDAMPSGGTIMVSTATVDLDQAAASRLKPMSPGRYVRLRVRDNGSGMDAVTQAKIFEPFFTTKPRGKGTGLGLSTVYGIIKQSGGFIWVESSPGEGAAFDIYLPALAEAVATPERAPVEAPAPAGASRGETVLLLEDEDGVRQLLATVLSSAGYRVIEAPSAEEGLQIALRSRQPIDILVTDIVMTGQNGVTAARQFLSAWPQSRVIFMSGYPDEMLIRELDTIPNATFIGKPFTPRDLQVAMRSGAKK